MREEKEKNHIITAIDRDILKMGGLEIPGGFQNGAIFKEEEIGY